MQILYSKLSTSSDANASSTFIKSVLLYDGSITIFDSRLYGFDIGTCLEVLGSLSDPWMLLRYGACFNNYNKGYRYNLFLLLIEYFEVHFSFRHSHFRPFTVFWFDSVHLAVNSCLYVNRWKMNILRFTISIIHCSFQYTQKPFTLSTCFIAKGIMWSHLVR